MVYLIKQISLDEKNGYESSSVVNHTGEKIKSAKNLLDETAINFVKHVFGIDAWSNAKIIEIHNFDQVCEPSVDSILLYRLAEDSHRIHVYQRRSYVTTTNGWFSTYSSPNVTWRKTHIFELEEYKNEINLGIGCTIPLPSGELHRKTRQLRSVLTDGATASMKDVLTELQGKINGGETILKKAT